MEKQSGTLRRVGSSFPVAQLHDEIFQALPPLASDEYVAHIQAAPVLLLPPESTCSCFSPNPANERGQQSHPGTIVPSPSG
jgi:hypothetical protein